MKRTIDLLAWLLWEKLGVLSGEKEKLRSEYCKLLNV